MSEEQSASDAELPFFRIDRCSGTRRKLCQSDISRLTDAENCCISLITEFLHSYEFINTIESFTKETNELKMASYKPFVKRDRIKKEAVLKILEYFSNNDQKNFFNTWESLVPLSFQQEMEYKKLTFYLHVHFAILSLRSPHISNLQNNASQNSGDETIAKFPEHDTSRNEADITNNRVENSSVESEESSNDMEMLKKFLETKGTEFSTEPEFLPYYALPFVSDPTTHPSFRDIFSESWVIRLRDNIEEFLLENCWGNDVAPELLRICSHLLQGQCLQPSHSQLLDLQKSYQQLRRRFHKINKDHHSLIGIATELTSALESSVKGQAVDLKSTLDNCMRIFPEIFRLSLQAENISHDESRMHDEERGSSGNFDLDFRKVKQHLIMGSVKTKLLLLQALRWRITKNSVDERDLVAVSYLRHDVLCLQPVGSPCESWKSADRPPMLLENFFAPPDADTPHPLQQAAARLVNSLASLRCGRDYLCSARRGLLKVLIDCLKGERNISIDSHTRVMIIATLQKLSLRYSQRVGMIRLELVEWLVQYLNTEYHNMKLYCLEYSTALLMNLCLHKKARERCVPLARTALKLLTNLLGTQVYHAIPYVNGTLYSLLGNEQINQEAKRIGLCKILEYYLKHSEGEIHRQLEHILNLHRRDCQPDSNVTSDEENEEDDIEDVILLEEELDADDPVRNSHGGELHGEQLLYEQYRLVFPHHVLAHPTSCYSGDVLKRPTTPRHSRSKSAEVSPPPPLLFGPELDECTRREKQSLMKHDLKQESVENGIAEDVISTTYGSLVEETHSENVSRNIEIEENSESVEEKHDSENSEKEAPENTETNDDLDNEADKEKIISENKNDSINLSAPSPRGDDEYSKAFCSRPRIPRSPIRRSP